MEWLPWSLLFIATAMLIVETWAARRCRETSNTWRDAYALCKQHRDALAVELAAAKRDKGQA